MPKAKPPQEPTRKRPRLTIQSTVTKQEDFSASAVALAAKLGWEGDPTWVANGITVHDAQRYAQKILHEAYAAAAKGQPLPDPAAAAKHLACDSSEAAILSEAQRLAYEAGKGAPLQGHQVRSLHGDVELSGSAMTMLNDFLDAQGAQ